MKIEIDNEVFNFLQRHASPFVDTPNSVLRRLLLGEKNTQKAPAGTVHGRGANVPGQFLNTTDKFVKSILKKEFKEAFARKDRFRYMFESENFLIYFQNFNQKNEYWWYRINAKPLEIMKLTQKTALFCFTNPAMNEAYLIPKQDVVDRINAKNWQRDNLEVNINHASSRWVDLEWDIKEYLRAYRDLENKS